jgi:hypothetical protein
VVLELELEELTDEPLKWKVYVDPSAGVEATFSCESIRVVGAVAFPAGGGGTVTEQERLREGGGGLG